MNRSFLVLTLLTFFDWSSVAEAARIKQKVKVRPHQGMQQNLRLNSSESVKNPESEEIWEEYLESRDAPEMMRKIKEKTLGRTLKALGVEGIETVLKDVEDAHLEEDHFEDFKALVTNTIEQIRDAEERVLQKAAENQGASSLQKSQERMRRKTRWNKILKGEEKCPTGVTVKFVKAATLEKALERGEARKYATEDTLLAFDMDGTLIDMRDYYPNEMMQTFNEFEAADKVIITAAENRGEATRTKKKGGCEAVGVSLLAALKDGESQMPATNGTACDDLVQGATWDMEAQLCQCPNNFFVNGINDVCHDKKVAWSEPLPTAVDPQLVQARGGRCYCEPDLFKTFGIDAVADCPDMEDSRGNFMIAKSGIVMDKYAKALGLNAYYRDPSLGRGRQVKQIVFFDDWVENPVNFADTMCFFEAPEGVEHIVGVWYATERMEEREKEKIANWKAGKLKGNAEGNYFNPDPVSDARLAGARQMFGQA